MKKRAAHASERRLSIEDYALIGDCHTAALVGRHGSIDWLCFPRFDSAACFAALLGGAEHGRWLLAPAAHIKSVRRQYLDDSLVLETEFQTARGRVRVIDFMPVSDERWDVVRIVEGLSGTVTMRMELIVRFDYGSIVPWVRRVKDLLLLTAGPDTLELAASVKFEGENMKTVAQFSVRKGQRESFVLNYRPSHFPTRPSIDAVQGIEAHAVAVAPLVGTLPLPRPLGPGGIAFADYAKGADLQAKRGRGCGADYLSAGAAGWGAQLGLPILLAARRDFHLECPAVGGVPRGGRRVARVAAARDRRLAEGLADRLRGNRRAASRRDSNCRGCPAIENRSRCGSVTPRRRSFSSMCTARSWIPCIWREPRTSSLILRHGIVQLALLEFLESHWEEPDEGIWEVRGPRRHFTHSKIMAWVAFDRAIKDAEKEKLKAPVARWRRVRARIHAQVCKRGFNRAANSFVQSYESKFLDASLLLIPQVGFLPADDPRVLGTIAAIEKHLLINGLVLRYSTATLVDALPAGEGTFLACSFWLADCYVLTGRRKEAEALFERLLALGNDVGLFAEEYDPRAKRMLGNFPQALTHMALVNTARLLSIPEKVAKQASARGERPGAHA